MQRFLKGSIRGEKGQALAIVLVLLAIGSLTIAVNLNYATTSLKGNQIAEKETAGVYAAGSGVEYVIWYLKNSLAAPTQLPENISGMSTTITTVDEDTQTLTLSGWTELDQSHPEYIGLDSQITWDAAAQAHRVTVTLTWQVTSGSPNITIDSLGIRIPVGYSYQSSPAPSGMSSSAPTQGGSSAAGYTLTWSTAGGSWGGGSGRPKLDDPTPHTLTQTFYITGNGSTDGGYAVVTTTRSDIGTVGEISGTLYRITATARRPTDNQITAEIVANAMIQSGGAVTILSWQITK